MQRLILLIVVTVLAGLAHAETVKGRIAAVSKQAGTLQIEVKGKDDKVTGVVVRTRANTVYDGAAGLDDLGPPDLVEVERDPGQPASRIRKVVFGLAPGVEIGIQELVGIMTGGQPYHLFDARPGKRFGAAHVPGAQSAFPKDADFLDRLPADRGALLVFYCGGPTCPYTGVAIDKAKAAGYTNLKGFQAGLPGWKKAKLPVHAEAGWLAKNLDPQHVVLDVRDRAQSAQAHIPGAVALPTAELQGMTRQFIERQQVAELPGLSDQRAPVIVYAESHSAPAVLLAYKELRSWGYGNTTVLAGGFDGWRAAGLPTGQGPAASRIVYEKRLAPGAIAPEEFVALHEAGDGVVLVDVRTPEEAANGVISGAMHLPLEQLEDRIGELPADKEVLIYCANGIRAEMAHQTLDGHGIRNRYLNETVTIAKDGSFTI
jgi:rhodanese-related sulfurtransferase